MLTNFNKMLKKLDNQDVEHCIDQYYGSYLPLGKLIRNLEQSLLGEKNMTLTQIYIDGVSKKRKLFDMLSDIKTEVMTCLSTRIAELTEGDRNKLLGDVQELFDSMTEYARKKSNSKAIDLL
ncbi:MAG: hypothetical protein IJC57_03315 [Clostridia bacterium]|nr:hypothetical protein [Clostridia bacterium]